MARKKNNTSELDAAQKQSTPLAQRLSEVISNTNELKEYLGCSIQAINQYKSGESRPSLENLCKIADFYGVSTDYLLGRAKSPTIDEDIQKAIKTTGLTEEAITHLNSIKREDLSSTEPDTLTILSFLILNEKFQHALVSLAEIQNNFDSQSLPIEETRSHYYKFLRYSATTYIMDALEQFISSLYPDYIATEGNGIIVRKSGTVLL